MEVAVDKLERQLRKLKGRLIARNRKPSDKHLNAALNRTDEEDELRIERVKQFIVKPMSPEEAALQMELLGHSFFLFFNDATGSVNVVYKRQSGNYGLLVPRIG